MKTSFSLKRFAWAGVAFALSAQLVGADPGKAQVTAVRGTATIGGVAAKVGDTAGKGSQLATAAASELSLYLDVNGPTLVLGASTKATFEELTADTAGPEAVIQTKVKLEEGRVTGFVKKTSDQSVYSISTPTTTAAIRGTKYMITAEGFVYVWEGCVDVTFKESRYEVCAGQAFDPTIPGIVPNPLPEPPAGTSAKAIVPPVGPERPLSPVSPSVQPSKGGQNQPGS